MSTPLATEAGSVQFPLVKHANAVGWDVISDTAALALRRDEGGSFFYDVLRERLLRLNPGIVSEDNVAGIIQRMEAAPPTIEGNREMLEWLRGNRTVFVEADKRHRNVRVVDFDRLDENAWHVTYEWSYKPGSRKGNRMDVVFLINGVPVAMVENKNPKKPKAMERALVQLQRYELETPEMLVAPQVFNITHLIEYFYGVTWSYARKFIFNWKDESKPAPAAASVPVLTNVVPDEPTAIVAETPPETAVMTPYAWAVRSFFDRQRFLTLLGEWILFYVHDDELRKTVLRQHQTGAAVKVVERCADPQKQTGLVWHTQGSGKTFTMITAARLILEDKRRFPAPTVMLVVDRNELEGQLCGWVERIVGEMQGRDIKVEYATSKARLQELLDADFRGLIVTMIHKFDAIRARSCMRKDFFVLIDEAHRSTGGDLGNYLMGALPAATFIGFTGTPIDRTAHGEGTFKTFGREDAPNGYLHKYPIRESIADKTTLKLRHQLAPSEFVLPDNVLEAEFLSLVESEGVSDIDDLNRILDRAVNLRAFLKGEARVEKVGAFIAKHFVENVHPLGYKAFVVAVDREACALYKRELDKHLPPEWSATIYTPNSDDVIERPVVAQQQLDEDEEKSARKLFAKPGEQPQILIVTDKLLTGYDAPILYCMYLDKPMRDHVLLQAVARVNRPYVDAKGVEKPCGLIIDFVGILKNLNKALAFDSEDVNGVIEDLELLLVRFCEMMGEPVRAWLATSGETKDEQLDRLLYERFRDPKRREEFTEYFQEVETLYEILSPSPELRDHLDDYRRLAELHAMLREAYGGRPTSFIGELCHKTEMLVRTTSDVAGLDRLTKVVEFDEAALDALKKQPGSDEGKVINLARSLQQSAQQQGEQEPHLIPIGERADAIMEQFEERLISTEQARERLEALAREKLEAEKERGRLGFDGPTFAIYWLLKKEGVEDAEGLAREAAAAFSRYPNHAANADELRQLKAEIYKVLLKVVSGRRMLDLADLVLKRAAT